MTSLRVFTTPGSSDQLFSRQQTLSFHQLLLASPSKNRPCTPDFPLFLPIWRMAALLTATTMDPVNRQCNPKCSTRLKHPTTVASKVIRIFNRHRLIMGTTISIRLQRATASKHLIKPSSSTSPSTMTCGLAYWYDTSPK